MTAVLTVLLTLGSTDVEFFEKEIRPLLVRECYGCHSARAKKLRGGLLLDSQDGWMSGGDSGPAIVPGKPEESLLIQAVSYQDEDLEMPPRAKLPEDDIRRLVKWVALGAPDPRTGNGATSTPSTIDIDAGRKFWAFQPPRDAPPPAVPDSSWPRDDIDRFIRAGLESKGLRPVADASRRALIRRLTFDLIGLPPTPEEVRKFVADTSSRAVEKVVDRLLASERFGERWGRHWLDIARYGESTGKTRNYPYSHAWRYRDYVIRAFNEDRPYDRFVTEQIAGDLLPAGDDARLNEQRTATGFLVLGPRDLNERNNRKYTMDSVDEQLDTMCQAILSLTVGCARCHDHKFDPVPQADYYAMAGFFRSTETLAGLANRGNRGEGYRESLLYPVAGAIRKAPRQESDKRAGRRDDEIASRLQKRRQTLRRQTLRRQLKGAQRRARGGEDGSRADTAKLRDEIRELGRRLRRRKQARKRNSPPPEESMIMGVRDRDDPVDCRILARGEVESPGAVVPRGFLQVIAGAEQIDIPEQSSGRLELARWLVSLQNPLTARVMVNRIWHHLFGRGLVRTVDNFGASGDRPSHPGLLDHLARRFTAGGWSIKKMIRTIVLTRTYGLATTHDAANYAIDPESVLRWRMSPRRLDAEAFRDAILSVSGSLDLTPPEGSPVTGLPVGEIGRRGRGAPFAAAAQSHRSIYLPIVRGFVPEILETFDFGDPSMVRGRREVTTVATQALYVMNSEFVREQSRRTARRLLQERGLSDGGRLRLAYRLALGRPPRAGESADATRYVKRRLKELTSSGRKSPEEPRLTAWAGLCQALFASAEFRYVN